jgi:FkbM family methyltransferase
MSFNNFKVRKIKVDQFYLNVLENDWVGSGLMGGKLWEPHIVNFLSNELNSDSVFIDAGCNYGYHSLQASKFCNKVYSFDPQKIMYELFLKTINDNNIKNISCFNYALGNEDKNIFLTKVDYQTGSFNAGETGVVYDTNRGEECKMVKLDSIIDNIVSIIKIDVQGYEKFIVEGCVGIIEKYHPHLIIEFENHQLGKFGYNSEQLFSYLKKLGYNLYLLDYFYPSDFVCVHETNLVKFIEKNKNFIKQLTENNSLNNCLNYGITEKISYSNDIIYNTIKGDVTIYEKEN